MTDYNIAKKLEFQLLEYLNTNQPLVYWDAFTNIELPIVEYFPSQYKYSKFDIYNEYTTIELKSRSDVFCKEPNNLLDVHKVLSNHSIFMFSHDNSSEVLTDLHFISYDKLVFSKFYIQNTRFNSRLYIIPKTTPTYVKLWTPYQTNYMGDSTDKHKININYTDEYKSTHIKLIAEDINKLNS